MANRKLKYFEFANHSTKKGTLKDAAGDEVTFFQCVNGSVFVICQDVSIPDEQEVKPAALASQRLKYYLENEHVEDPADALYNALVYTNGFIFEYGRKNEDFVHSGVYCSCLLIRDGKAFYYNSGKTAMFFFNGKKVFLVGKGDDVKINDEDTLKNSSDIPDINLLGVNKNIQPLINKEPLLPVNDDMLLMCSDGLYEVVNEKNIQKILSDPMPVQTKVFRLADLAGTKENEKPVALQLVSFYNLNNTSRFFKPLEQQKKRAPRKKKAEPQTEAGKSLSESSQKKISETIERFNTPLTQNILIALAILVIAFMFYDIFIRDPMPPVKKTGDDIAVPADEVSDVDDAEVLQPDNVVTTPADTVYLVQSGDNWSRIYSRFEVCSWFIRSHPENEGLFNSDDNPVAGRRITIPLIYSASEEYNPDFYTEFSLEKTGRRCENANQEFLDAFRQAHL